jgi:hypothetical protein
MGRRFTLFSSSRSYAAAPRVQTGEAGSDGDTWWGGLIGSAPGQASSAYTTYGATPDPNPALTGVAKFDTYHEMSLTDPSIKSLLLFLLLPVRSAVWGLDPAIDGDPESLRIRDAVAWNFGLDGEDGQMDLSWDELLQQGGYNILKYGPCIEELVWGDLATWHDADGTPLSIRPLARLALRMPRTIDRVKFDRGQVSEVTQNLPGTRPIPGDKLSYMVWERDGNRWDGVSMLRPAWGAWYSKKTLMVAAGIAWDRFAATIPVVWHPDTPEGEARAREIGRNIRQHERASVHFPVPQGASPADSEWKLDGYKGQFEDPVPLMRFYTEQIAEAGLQQFSKLGMTDTGSRAVASVQIDPFFLGVQALAKYLLRERRRQAMRKFVEVNFGAEAADKRLPKLTVSKIQAQSVAVLAQAISYLEPAGLTLAPRDWNDVREMLGFAAWPEDELQARGVDPATLKALLAKANLTPEQLAAVLDQLPADVGVARNRVPEGTGLAPV